MFDKSNVYDIIKQAQSMQEKIQRIQNDIAKLEVIGESGAGLIKLTLNGAYHCLGIKIDPSLLQHDPNILEDLIIAAFNDAVHRIKENQKSKMATASINM